ncbi:MULTISPECIES: MmcB family DNA repair protein [unclassified Roseitalea]|uniref:MmcB family DNA repair protein n=1 Tax=unclassified Roseitalea TaxID=2639107 RepID=UPI00273DD6D4|nr:MULTISPECIES: MmcB family DNA repair protein [unclassified Roseitalea]
MPLVTVNASPPTEDGRQSDRALRVRRGVQTLLFEAGLALVPEMTLANGRRADLVGLTREGAIWIVEIKSSPADLRADRKWPDYRDFCDRFFFATLPDVPQALFPAQCGFIRADAHGAEILVEAPEHRLAAARRKAMTLRFARFAAERLLAAEWMMTG